MTVDDLNPQRAQMADESMVRNLAAQAEAIWPQERPLFLREPVRGGGRILDAGCGTGEITSRLAELFSEATVEGVDIIDAHLQLAARRYASLAPRLRFSHADIYQLPFPDGSFDVTVCRHVLQAIPHAERVLRELGRVTRPGGILHLIPEDYGMIQMAPTRTDIDRFWYESPRHVERASGIDLHIGRHAAPLLARLGFADVTLDYVVVDTLRVPRETFARIWEAWRDGYTDVIAEHTGRSRKEVADAWADMIECIRNPDGYAVWQVPVVRARRV